MSTPDSAIATSRRDPDNRMGPSAELARAAEGKALIDVELDLPQYGAFRARGVTDYESIKEILAHEAARQGLKDASQGSTGAQPGFLLYYDGEKHRQLRDIYKAALSASRVSELRPEVEAIVAELLDAMEGDPERAADLQADYAMQIPSKVICKLLGVPFEHSGTFERWAKTVSDLTSTPEQALGAVGSIHDYMAEEVRRNRALAGDNIIGVLVRDAGEVLTDEEITGLAMITLVGGLENTASSISLSVFALLQHPEQLAIVRDDQGSTRRAVEELLRYTSLVASPPNRLLVEDLDVGPHRFRAGERVVTSFLAANWSTTLTDEPSRLDVTRKPTAHLAFGHGPHGCPGQHLARLEIGVAIPALLRRFPALRLNADPEEFDWRWNASLFGVRTLPVAW